MKATKKENLELAKAPSKSIHKPTNNENLELAKEHLDIAEDLINNEAKKSGSEEETKKFAKTQFDLERAEADIEDVEGEEKED